MKCPKCGLEELGSFCSNCGSKIPEIKNDTHNVKPNKIVEAARKHLEPDESVL